jgi:phosphate transport system substrate-binding protein
MAPVGAILVAAGLLVSQASDHPLPVGRSNADPLVIATSQQLAALLQRTASELQRERPGVKISIVPVGSDVAMAELYTRQADLAIIGRAATDPEVKAFQWIYQYPPSAWAVLRGSLAAAGHSPSVRLLVNASNPITRVSPQQLELVYRGKKPVRWRDLGVKGPLGRRLVHPIMPNSEQGTGRFIRDVLFKGSTLFAWERVQEITEPLHRGGVVDGLGARISEAVARDPQALAFLPGNPGPRTRIVPLSCDDSEIASRCDNHGALERSIYAYSDPGLRPIAREFLRILIKTGDGDFAPYRQLPANEARELLGKLR